MPFLIRLPRGHLVLCEQGLLWAACLADWEEVVSHIWFPLQMRSRKEQSGAESRRRMQRSLYYKKQRWAQVKSLPTSQSRVVAINTIPTKIIFLHKISPNYVKCLFSFLLFLWIPLFIDCHCICLLNRKNHNHYGFQLLCFMHTFN